ncbi:putative ubiquitin carboxyl-terminal hydrolase 50 [Hypomesus transpacificus]|uniref:putative ubiquitin carboxyl-terminal hydrolase 50 n=1 Tax=Hypomesus transpacificus TaxID=137520 RepID=UPI001F07E2D3|nr:putative ubiquitin carboxyl-terminal hydrolase 50 [Hypomesus transpacificus]
MDDDDGSLGQSSRDLVMCMEEEGASSLWGVPMSRKAGVCGLINSGNSCYMNAVLQCLCSTVPLVEYLLSRHTQTELAKHESMVVRVFVTLLEEVWLGQSPSYVPGDLRSMVSSLHPQFNNHSQQDAQELLLFLLNALHDDLKKKGATRFSSRHGRKSPGGESTIITRLFEGQLSYVTLCMRCDQQGQSNQVFTILSLPMPADVYKCSLQDCLSLFFQQSTLTGGDQKLCTECGIKRDTAVITTLSKPPEILMLHLKRFGCHGTEKKKLRTNVLFSMDNLDLSPFLTSPSALYTSYSLYAVVNHTGDLDMGHYTALCHSTLSHAWHRFDDTTVTEIQDFLVQSPNTYILLYSRRPFTRPDVPGL